MKAMIFTKVGKPEDVLKLIDIEKPVPKDNQVLIKVKAVGLNLTEFERFKSVGKIPPPQVMMLNKNSLGHPLGGESSGIVVEIGKNVKNFKIGDEVYGQPPEMFPTGAWAEYVAMDEWRTCVKPTNLSFEEAAIIPSSCETALGAVRKAGIKRGQEVMVYGASGGVGGYAAQLAKALGAMVTGVCSTRNVEVAKSIGCDCVIDYKNEDFTKTGKTYDAIIGVNGYNPMKVYKKLLKNDGIFVGIGGMKQAFSAMGASIFSKKITTYVASKPIKDALPYFKELAEAGKLKPHVDKVYDLQNVAEAINYVITEHAQGKVALRVDFEK